MGTRNPHDLQHTDIRQLDASSPQNLDSYNQSNVLQKQKMLTSFQYHDKRENDLKHIILNNILSLWISNMLQNIDLQHHNYRMKINGMTTRLGIKLKWE